jgi:hypothetical protein
MRFLFGVLSWYGRLWYGCPNATCGKAEFAAGDGPDIEVISLIGLSRIFICVNALAWQHSTDALFCNGV